MGIAYLLEPGAFRALGAYQLSPETATLPSLHVSAGVQGIGTGNPGYSATAEKNFGRLNVFAGLGYRTNRGLLRGVGGIKYGLDDRFTVGIQDDGLVKYPFATYNQGQATLGVFLIAFKRPAFMVGMRF